MDRYSAFTQTCTCSRTFSQVGALKNHQNSCKKDKKRLTNVLTKVKKVLADKKRNSSAIDTSIGPMNVCNDNSDDLLVPEPKVVSNSPHMTF
jgi:hypothetical protein